jgi:DNA polymerase
MDPRQSAAEAIQGFCRSLQMLACSGWRGFECSARSLEILRRWETAPEWLQPSPATAPAVETLAGIRDDLGECTRCRLSQGRRNIVFGAGNPEARLVFVGEGPGYEEDVQGQPFVGAAGRLLTRIIQAMGLEREQVYICNIIKCRPPQNRDPQPDEIERCAPFLRRQLQSIDPEFICALGSFAARTLLETDRPISRLRGRFYPYLGARLIPTYHPAYLLRSPEKKRETWQDIQLLMKAMNLPIPDPHRQR